MRISDWSSDVCSSDLCDFACERRASRLGKVTVVLRPFEREDRLVPARAGFKRRADRAMLRRPAIDLRHRQEQATPLRPRAFQFAIVAILIMLVEIGAERDLISEERRIGKEDCLTCRSTWSTEP